MKVGKLKKSIGDTSRIVRYMWYAFGGIVVLVVAAFAMIAWGWIGYMPPIEDMENPKDKFASEIYSSDMEVIGRFYQSKSNRVYVHYDEISPYLVNALIATEDIRFKDHSGIYQTRAIISKECGGRKYDYPTVGQTPLFS